MNQGPVSQILTSPPQHQGSLVVLQIKEGVLSAWHPPFSHSAPATQLTMIQQIADHFLTASADCVVQECAALLVTVHEITSCSV